LGLALAGCAGSRLVGGVFQAAENRYAIRPPGNPWVPLSQEADRLAFQTPEGRATIALLQDCESPERGELGWVARHLFFGLRERETQARETIEVAGIRGVRTQLAARLEDAPVEVEAVTLRHGGCLYDFVYVADPDVFAAARPAFEAFVGSWMPRARP
jgi:hypothetical protein